jgi:hypothetical protein
VFGQVVALGSNSRPGLFAQPLAARRAYAALVILSPLVGRQVDQTWVWRCVRFVFHPPGSLDP